MKVSIFGLGYVGCVTAGCFSKDGHRVIGVDIMTTKVERLAAGLPTVVETGLDEVIADGHRAGLLTATEDSEAAVVDTDASIICVGTPNAKDGSLDLTYVVQTAMTIGRALRQKGGRHVVILRSTVPAGTAESIVLPALLKASGRQRHEIGLVVVPEFLREGCAIADYYDPPFVVVGSEGGGPGADGAVIEALFGGVVDELRWVPFREAEMLKVLCNAFHAMKVAFANEVGALCQSLSVNGHSVMRQLVQDRKLNISPAYLRPGLPFGGSCLPKDLRMVISLGTKGNVELPLFKGILASNEAHTHRAIADIRDAGCRCIGLDGLSFKPGTDDLRESPMVQIAEYFIGKGYELSIFDPAIETSRLTGTNREYIEKHIPHLSSRLINDPEVMVDRCDVIIFTRDDSLLRRHVEALVEAPMVIDLTGREAAAPSAAKPAPAEAVWALA
jgi:GDP-mannose 6-dehydrogenase